MLTRFPSQIPSQVGSSPRMEVLRGASMHAHGTGCGVPLGGEPAATPLALHADLLICDVCSPSGETPSDPPFTHSEQRSFMMA